MEAVVRNFCSFLTPGYIEIGGSFTPRPIYSNARAPCVPWVGGCIGLRYHLDKWKREKSLAPARCQASLAK